MSLFSNPAGSRLSQLLGKSQPSKRSDPSRIRWNAFSERVLSRAKEKEQAEAAQRASELAEETAVVERQRKLDSDLQTARDNSTRLLAEMRATSDRVAAERETAQTLRTNSQADLTTSGDPLIISGGSADEGTGDELAVKKKLKGSGISAQVGINV